MKRAEIMKPSFWRLVCWLLAIVSTFPTTKLGGEELIQLKNGFSLRGFTLPIGSMNQNPFASAANNGQIKAQPILLIDDQLRRTYVHRNGMVVGQPNQVPDLERSIEFWHPIPLGGKAVGGLGSILNVSPFNDYGRRVMVIRGPEGSPIEVIQGIMELNARYVKLEALKAQKTYVWDMRVATSSIDSATLSRIFNQRIDQSNVDRRLEVVRFFIEAKRYAEARSALQAVIEDFPDQQDLAAQVVMITEMQAGQLLDEAEQRAAAGQELLAERILDGFPLADVSRVTRIRVQDALEKLKKPSQQAQAAMDQLRGQVAQLKPADQAALNPILTEMQQGLSSATLSRLSDYLRLGTVETVPLDNRVALAVAGWLLGSGSGEQNLIVTISLIRVRDLVAEYLATDDAARRAQVLDELRTLEGAQPEYIARILPLLQPPLPWPEDSQITGQRLAAAQAEQESPGEESAPDDDGEIETGMFAIDLDNGDDPIEIRPRYLIQLPPEYDPLREYPCIVALGPTSGTPEQQLDWWAGPYHPGSRTRLGHATRNGYIVIAPVWTRGPQSAYEYTQREHQRVLTSLRDAMRRASIDSDRVFITGHGAGATAAWDIAVSHPDLWAGMIAIGADPDKTIRHYYPNAERVPMYFVLGEDDRVRTKNNYAYGAILDDYVKVRNDVMVVMYRGRGREFFFEEIQRFFEWMNLDSHHRRDPPASIETVTMRTGDQFFWWLELGPLKPAVDINPVLWSQAERLRAGKISGAVGANNSVRISGPAEEFNVLLGPNMGVDLTQSVTIRYGSRTIRYDFDGNFEYLLEDVRTRADRKRPYWAKVSVP
tara:strand:- start:75820 stop:78297 length:2478 start_codon:yes stop_codon:yes gene_type:complete